MRRNHSSKWLRWGAAVLIGGIACAQAACYVNVVWFCGARTLSKTIWPTPETMVIVSCTDPGDTGYKYNGAAVGQSGNENLQHIDYE